jgi:hypothetical protein
VSEPTAWTIEHFSLANPKGQGQGNVPLLLRRVADVIEGFGTAGSRTCCCTLRSTSSATGPRSRSTSIEARPPKDTDGGVTRTWQAIVFGFLGGVLAANGYPDFTRGITKRRYPGGLGNGLIPNFVAGWAALVLAALLFWIAHVGRHPGWSLGAAAVGSC